MGKDIINHRLIKALTKEERKSFIELSKKEKKDSDYITLFNTYLAYIKNDTDPISIALAESIGMEIGADKYRKAQDYLNEKLINFISDIYKKRIENNGDFKLRQSVLEKINFAKEMYHRDLSIHAKEEINQAFETVLNNESFFNNAEWRNLALETFEWWCEMRIGVPEWESKDIKSIIFLRNLTKAVWDKNIPDNNKTESEQNLFIYYYLAEYFIAIKEYNGLRSLDAFTHFPTLNNKSIKSNIQGISDEDFTRIFRFFQLIKQVNAAKLIGDNNWAEHILSQTNVWLSMNNSSKLFNQAFICYVWNELKKIEFSFTNDNGKKTSIIEKPNLFVFSPDELAVRIELNLIIIHFGNEEYKEAYEIVKKLEKDKMFDKTEYKSELLFLKLICLIILEVDEFDAIDKLLKITKKEKRYSDAFEVIQDWYQNKINPKKKDRVEFEKVEIMDNNNPLEISIKRWLNEKLLRK